MVGRQARHGIPDRGLHACLSASRLPGSAAAHRGSQSHPLTLPWLHVQAPRSSLPLTIARKSTRKPLRGGRRIIPPSRPMHVQQWDVSNSCSPSLHCREQSLFLSQHLASIYVSSCACLGHDVPLTCRLGHQNPEPHHASTWIVLMCAHDHCHTQTRASKPTTSRAPP